MVMMSGAGLILQAGHDGFAHANRQVGDHAIERRERVVLMQHVVDPHQVGLRLAMRRCMEARLRGVLLALRAGLRDAGFRLLRSAAIWAS